MLQRLKQNWRELRSDAPGKRFQRRYERSHEGDASAFRRWGTLALGIIVLAAGIFFLPAPGPGIVIVAIGAGLIARESSHAARLLDGAELRIRRLLDWGRGVWERASGPVRVLLVALAAAVTAAFAYLAYWFFFVR